MKNPFKRGLRKANKDQLNWLLERNHSNQTQLRNLARTHPEFVIEEFESISKQVAGRLQAREPVRSLLDSYALLEHMAAISAKVIQDRDS